MNEAPDAVLESPPGFAVHLENFDGPFDLLLQLLSKHQLDIGDIALSRVTDEFLAHLAALGSAWELDETTSFLVVASTLLDLKIVRLLPSAEVEDESDLALLEARDLLFARLLQYRAFKQAAALMGIRLHDEACRFARAVALEEHVSAALPEVILSIGPDDLARLAARALAPRETPVLGLEHLHVSRVSVREQATTLVGRLIKLRSATFRGLTADSPDLLTTVARFLALLELYREGVVGFDQVDPLGELTIRWTGPDDDPDSIDIIDEYADDSDSVPPDPTPEARTEAAQPPLATPPSGRLDSTVERGQE